MPTNTHLTPQEITKEALRLLVNNLAFVRTIDRSYDNRFAQAGKKIGDTVDIRLPNQFTTRQGMTRSAQDYTERKTPFAILDVVGIDLTFSAWDMTLKMDDFSSRVLKPAMATMANKLDLMCLGMTRDVFPSVGTPGTTPATAAAILAAGEKLDDYSVPRDGRSMVVNPAGMAALVNGMSGFFNPQGAISDQFKRGEMGKNVLGFDSIVMDQNLCVHTVGPLGGTPLVDGADQVGATLNTKEWTAAAAARLKKGDVFTVAGVYQVNVMSKQTTGKLQQFVVTADKSSGADGKAAVAIAPAIVISGAYQNVTAAPADGAEITVIGTASTAYPQNLAYHKEAFTLATVDMEEPPKGSCEYHAETYEGIRMSYVRGFDISDRSVPVRFDVMYGFKCIRPEMACRVWG
jgi:hypothetical protein